MSSRLALLSATVAALALASAGSAFAEPDITGVWAVNNPPRDPAAPRARGGNADLLPEVRAKDAETQKISAAHNRLIGEGHTKCWPTGMPGLMTTPFGIEFLQTKGRVTVLQEVSNLPRTIYLDEKEHPKPDDMLPSWNGHSIGHWEGDTLMVDTVGFNGRVNHVSAKAHITEKIHLQDGYLFDEMTIEDPLTYSAPQHSVTRYKRAEGREANELMEYVCEVDPTNLFTYEAEQKAAGRKSDWDPAWAASAFVDPATAAAEAEAAKKKTASLK